MEGFEGFGFVHVHKVAVGSSVSLGPYICFKSFQIHLGCTAVKAGVESGLSYPKSFRFQSPVEEVLPTLTNNIHFSTTVRIRGSKFTKQL